MDCLSINHVSQKQCEHDCTTCYAVITDQVHWSFFNQLHVHLSYKIKTRDTNLSAIYQMVLHSHISNHVGFVIRTGNQSFRVSNCEVRHDCCTQHHLNTLRAKVYVCGNL